jgi:hypothetical protein
MAARIYLENKVATLVEAAESCGSSVPYVRAGIVLRKAGNTSLIGEVLAGRVPLLAAAAETKRFVDLVTAYKAAEDSDRVAFARACGAEAIFDVLVAASS